MDSAELDRFIDIIVVSLYHDSSHNAIQALLQLSDALLLFQQLLALCFHCGSQ